MIQIDASILSGYEAFKAVFYVCGPTGRRINGVPVAFNLVAGPFDSKAAAEHDQAAKQPNTWIGRFQHE